MTTTDGRGAAVDPAVFGLAADLIIERGWWSGSLTAVPSSICAALALTEAAATLHPALAAAGRNGYHARVAAALGYDDSDTGLTPYRTVVVWNDAQSGPAPILDLYRRLAAEEAPV